MWQPPPLPRTLAAALRDVADTSDRVRLSALQDLAAYASGAERDQVLAAGARMLRDPLASVRARAATLLGESQATGHLAELLDAIDDDDALVRQMALDALGGFDDARARARLQRALSDPRPEMRFQATMAYPRGATDDDAAAALVSAMRDDDESVRYIALRVAEERWPEGAVPARVLDAAEQALRDECREPRVAAALLLTHGGSDAGADVLLAVAEDRLATREAEDEAAALEAIGALGLAAGRAALARRAWGAGRLFRERFAFHAKIGLARLGDPRARRDLVASLEAWTRARRNLAVVAIGRARLRDARPELEALRGQPARADQELVEEALRALCDVPDPT